MNPTIFKEANQKFRAPEGLDESQVMTIHGYTGKVDGGSLDGLPISVTAWQPTLEEIELIKQGHPIFLSFIGGLPPHFPAMDFHQATHPA